MKPTQPHLITDPTDVLTLAEKLEGQNLIALDTEFIRETSFYPRIALLQIATDQNTWLIDPTVLNPKEMEPVLRILTHPKILKVIHASHADQECLFWTYGVIARPVLDTSVAAALCGMGDSIGLQKLLREVLGVHVSKGRARAKWLTRPLPMELLKYAEQDVAHLVLLGQKLKGLLDRHRRWDWALEESEVDQSFFEISPKEMASKIAKGAHLEKEESVLWELVSWRENRAKEANLPRGWIADNEVLIALARSQPKSVEELRTFRGLHSKEVDRSGAKIIEAIQKGKLQVGERIPEPRFETPRIDPHAANLIQTYISFLASKNEIMPRYLMNNHQSSQILYHLDKSPSEWVELGILSSQAAQLIGEDLVALFRGDRALKIKNKKLLVVDVPEK